MKKKGQTGDLETLEELHKKILEVAKPYGSRVVAMTCTAILAEVIANDFLGNDEEILNTLRLMISEYRRESVRELRHDLDR